MIKVYVSSTFNDLKKYREEVRKVLRQLNCMDVAMEYYVAEDKRPVEKCLTDVAACDIYIGIFALRYGWRPQNDNPNGYSITEMEYRQAKTCGKTCFIFTLDPGFEWTSERDADSTEIDRLRNELSEEHGGGIPFTNPESLATQVAVAFNKWKNPLLIQNTRERVADDKKHFFLQAKKGADQISFEDQVLDALKPRKSGRHALVLQGMGGVGKSFLAQEVANGFCRKEEDPRYNHKEGFPRFNIVWWVDSDGMSRRLTDPNDDALSDLAALARRLPKEDGNAPIDLQRKGWVQDLLAHLETKQYRFLLIFDNACDGDAENQLTPEQFAKRYFPKTNNADQQVIVTSRNLDWQEFGFKTLSMETWSTAEYETYFRRSGVPVTPADNSALREIHTELEGLALAALLSVRYLAANPDVSLTAYAESLKDEVRLRETVDRELPVLNYSRSIHAAMLITYRSLGDDAKSLLHQLVLMAPDDIPVLKMATNMNGSGLAADNPFGSVQRTQNAVRSLENAALIRRVSDKDDEFSIHRLIRFSVQQQLIDDQKAGLEALEKKDPHRRPEPAGNAPLVLDAAFNGTISSFAGSTDRFKKDHYPFYRKLLPHLDTFTAYLMSRIDKQQVTIAHDSSAGPILQSLLRDAGKYCFEVGNLAMALRLFDFALIWSQSNDHEIHQINLDKAYGLMLRDRNEEAMQLSAAALRFYEEKYDGTDQVEWIIESRNKMGKIFQRIGEFGDADACAAQCLADLERQNDEALNRKKRSGLLHDKAAACWDRGVDQKEAADLFQKAIDYKKEDPAVDDTNLHLNCSRMIKGVAHVLTGDYLQQRENHRMAFNCFSEHDDREYRRYSYTAFYRLHFAWDEIGWSNRAAALTDPTITEMLDKYCKHETVLDGDIKFRIIKSIVGLRQAVRKPDTRAAAKNYQALMRFLEDKKHEVSERYIDDGTVAVSAVLDYGLFLLETGDDAAIEVLQKADELLRFKDENGNPALLQYHRRDELEASLRAVNGF